MSRAVDFEFFLYAGSFLFFGKLSEDDLFTGIISLQEHFLPLHMSKLLAASSLG